MQKLSVILTTRRQKGASNINGVFYDSSEYPILTKVVTTDLDDRIDIDQSDCDEDQQPPSKKGRPAKSFLDLQNDGKRKRSQDVYDKMLNFCESEKLPLDQCLAYIGRRYYLSPGPDYNKEKGDVFNELFKGKEFASFRDVLKGVA